jgi:SAM-dependent methyltransferase
MDQVARIGMQSVGQLHYDQDFLSQDRLNLVNKRRTSAFPWRGQFSPDFIEALLEAYAEPGYKVLDPFVGSGTVLFEAARYGLESAGLEINPAAFELSYVATLCKLSESERVSIFEKLVEIFRESFPDGGFDVSTPEGRDIVERIIRKAGSGTDLQHIARVSLMIAAGSGKVITNEKLSKSLASLKQAMSNLPPLRVNTRVELTDARKQTFGPEEFDLVITSPPYINVFNYHQNYRPIVEAVGYKPLDAARSEIGSNRSNRSNRFRTVVQYCLDMQLVLTEVSRVLRRDGKLILVVGKESKVMGVPFANADILAAIAVESGLYRLERKQQRRFTNRFGVHIYEDVLTLVNCRPNVNTDLDLSRAIARYVLSNASANNPVIQEVIDNIASIKPSALG